jgi:trimethylamine--corrinoid protein Co-methyltransferase
MSVCRLSVLSDEDIETVHDKTLEMLEETGVRVKSESTLEILERGGAIVDWDIMTAYLPEYMVDDAVKRLPKEISLCGRLPERDMRAPKLGPPFMATNGTAVYITDLETGEKRTSMGGDLRDLMLVCDALDPIDYAWPLVTAHDGPAGGHGLNDLAIALQSTSKHFQGEAMSGEEARAMVRMASAVVGGEEKLAQRPIFSVIQCPICPLEFEKGSVEAVVEFARSGVPVVSMSMALCGLTSPVSLASTVAIVNAENLASFVISQLAKPGAPVVYSSESSVINMQTGEIKYGAMEQAITAAAIAQMAKHYGAPTMVGSFGVGLHGDVPGITADPAEIAFTMMTNMALTDFASGLGGIDQAKGASLEQLVMDSDIWESMRQVRRDVSFEDDDFLLELIDSVGPGGNFLNVPHTARNMRKELFIPDKSKADLYESYRLDADQGKAVSAARERVRRILSTHEPEPIEPDAAKDIQRILAEYGSGA